MRANSKSFSLSLFETATTLYTSSTVHYFTRNTESNSIYFSLFQTVASIFYTYVEHSPNSVIICDWVQCSFGYARRHISMKGWWLLASRGWQPIWTRKFNTEYASIFPERIIITMLLCWNEWLQELNWFVAFDIISSIEGSQNHSLRLCIESE